MEGMNVSTSQEAPLSAMTVDLSVKQYKENVLPHPIPALCTPAVGNHSARAALRLDLNAPDRASLSPGLLKSCLAKLEQTEETPCRQALVTPTEMRSLGKQYRQQISNIEKSLTPKSRLSTGLEMFAGNTKESEINVEDNTKSGLCDNEQSSCQISETDSDTLHNVTSTETKDDVPEDSGNACFTLRIRIR